MPIAEQEIVLKQLNIKTGKTISPELRSFALTLNYYSASAYNYVRKQFNNCLPHPSTLRKWYGGIDGQAGFLNEALNAVKIKVDSMAETGQILICSLMMDEMSIKKDVHFNNNRNIGYVNFGVKNDSDGLPMASDIIVFLLVAINSNWKVPVAYFLINGLTASEKANLVNHCLKIIHETGVTVKSLTFDGAASNMSMARELGANLQFSNLQSYFNHPITKEKIFIMLDAAHMLKLCRNALGDHKLLYDENDLPIKWQYFKELVSVQENIGLHLGTNIRKRHILYDKEKMKVSLAAQTLSSSVADAFQYCSEVLNMSSFTDCDSTITFCRQIDHIFDFLNARNFLSKSPYKKPLFLKDIEFCHKFISDSIQYLQSLKDKDHKPILLSSRKTGFMGLIICLTSVKQLLDELVASGKLKFLLTYKLSQDHLEILFSAIRARNGFNNNPTATQVEASMKRILVHTEIMTSSGANCLPQDATTILHVSSSKKKENREDYIDILCGEDTEMEYDYCDDIVDNINNHITHDVIEYIAGAIVRKIKKIIQCNECAAVLSTNNNCSLIDIKTRGYLIKPSKDVTDICIKAERVFKSNTVLIKQKSNPINTLIVKTTSTIEINKLFQTLNNHILNQSPLHNHLLQLIKNILLYYFKIRIHHYNKNQSQPQQRIRSALTKIIHFKHQ